MFFLFLLGKIGILAIDPQHFRGKSPFAFYNQRRHHLQKRLAAPAPLQQKEPGSGIRTLLHHAQALGFQAIPAHGLHHIGQALRTLADTEASAEFEQPGRRPADIVNGAGCFMPGNLVAVCFGQNAPALDLIGRVAGDNIKALSLGQGGEIGEIRQHRHHLSFQAVFLDGDGELVDGLGLDIHPIALTGLGLLGAVPGQSHNAAAGTQVTGPVLAPGRGKIRKQERIGAEFMLRGDTEPDPVTQGFKMITVIHGGNTASSGSAHR